MLTVYPVIKKKQGEPAGWKKADMQPILKTSMS
jgi:hypothetical protein